jgi:uncharacterized protein YlxP (DUF503 family)
MIASLKIQIHLPDSQSLKQKRSVIKSLKERLSQKFNIAIAEVDDLEKWQLSTLEIAAVSNDHLHLNKQIEKINASVDQLIAGNGFVTFREVEIF